MITMCAHSACTRAAFRGLRYCLPHQKALDLAVGRIHYDAQRQDLLANTPSLHVTDAHEVAEQVAGEAHPPRYKLTHRGQVRECQGGLPSLGKDQ